MEQGNPQPAAPQPQWGYGWAPAAPAPRSKRPHSDSEDDAFSEESSKDATSPGGDSCQLMTRKRRRGVIEKKRRDRINTSLTELKRLVPAACEKQGSAKLEKAEILQLTVDHLKMLHAKGELGLVSLLEITATAANCNSSQDATCRSYRDHKLPATVQVGGFHLAPSGGKKQEAATGAHRSAI
ncbi:unnamed protein product, partial [Iphiclides podalirius]